MCVYIYIYLLFSFETCLLAEESNQHLRGFFENSAEEETDSEEELREAGPKGLKSAIL